MAIKEYISEEQIKKRNQELGAKITKDFEGQELTVIAVLTGSFLFCADLIREIKLPITVEFITASSYGDDTKSSGEVKIDLSLKYPIAGKNVLIVEDIVDTGLTINKLFDQLKEQKPKKIKLATLLNKPCNTVHPVTIDYEGFEIDNKFVIGYGLDFAGKFRELPYIGIYSEE